jgi:hypothetical protein
MPVRTANDNDEPSNDILAALRQLGLERSELARREAALVRRARNEGIVWEQIASCLSVTKQTVHRKYAAGIMRR